MGSNDAAFWIAIVGAGAWLPQIGSWIHKSLLRPEVGVYLGGNVDVGFTDEGPGLGVPMIMTARKKDCVVTAATATVRHQQGETHRMRWKWVSEVKGFLSGIPGTAPLTFHQAELAIAIPLATKDIVSRRINFREAGFEGEMQRRISSVTSALDGVEGEARTQVREWRDAVQWYRKAFFWKEGTYSVTLDFTASDARDKTKLSFSFTLTEPDLAPLRENVEVFVRQRALAVANPLDPNANSIANWSWCNKAIVIDNR